MVKLNPYLIFKGNTEEAFNFYKSVFGGEFEMLSRFKDTPEGNKVEEKEKDKIMHVSLPLGNGYTLMASDMLDNMGPYQQGNNFNVALETQSEEETKKLFDGLAHGGNVLMPLTNTFWGAYFGMVTDKFGIKWMVSYTKPQS